jgi:ABC-type branched-subunit amino acid transport system ATPase component/MFS family permease
MNKWLRSFGRTLKSWATLGSTPYGLTPVVIVGLIAFTQNLDSETFRLAQPDIAKAFNINVGTIINIQLLISFLSVFGAIWAGWYADRHIRLPLYLGGAAASGIAGMASAAGSTLYTLGTPRVLDDLANNAANVPQGSLLADYYPVEARGRVFAVLGTVTALSALVALPLGGAAVTYLGLHTTFFIFGLPILVLAIVGAVALREPVRGYFERRAMGLSEETARVEDEPVSFGEAWRTVWSVRTVRRLFLAQIFFGGATIGFLYFPFALAEHYGLSAFQRGALQLPALIVTMIGGVLGGGLVDRYGTENPGRALTVVAIYSAIAGVGLFALAPLPPLAVVAMAIAVYSFGRSMLGPALLAMYSQVLPPNVRTLGLQVTVLAELPGAMIMTQVFSNIRLDHGYGQVFLFATPFLIVGTLIAASAGTYFEIDRRSAIARAVASEEWRQTVEAGKAKLLVCRDVDVDYSGVRVLFGVDFDVEEGEIIALLGTNGAGKSTLLRAISGTQEASSGSIVFDGRDIAHMPPHEVARRRVIHMPGGRGVFPGLTVAENIVLGNWMTEDPDEVRRRIDEAYEIFPVLAARTDELASSLSGGEQQMLSLAQAFMANPRLLMIDELSLGLSPAVVGQLLDIVREIHRRGVTIIVVEQSVNVALNIATKAVFMEKGEVRFVGPTADLLARPEILRAVYVKGTGTLNAAPRATRPPSDSRPALEVDGVVKRFGGVTALDGVSLDVPKGSVVGLIGPNGSGKTTLFDVISGYQPPDAGVIRYDGLDITMMSPEERARAKLVRRFQDARLFPSLTVTEALLVALDQRIEVRSTLLAALRPPNVRRSERRVRAQADRLVELLGLGAYRDKFVKELSTGVRRVVDLAWVLAQEPKVLLLDEPSSGVAQSEAEGLGPLLQRVRYETGCSILLIEHDMPLISAVSDELIALDQGQVVVRGAADEVLNDQRVIESYLGGSEAAIQRSGARS